MSRSQLCKETSTEDYSKGKLPSSLCVRAYLLRSMLTVSFYLEIQTLSDRKQMEARSNHPALWVPTTCRCNPPCRLPITSDLTITSTNTSCRNYTNSTLPRRNDPCLREMKLNRVSSTWLCTLTWHLTCKMLNPPIVFRMSFPGSLSNKVISTAQPRLRKITF